MERNHISTKERAEFRLGRSGFPLFPTLPRLECEAELERCQCRRFWLLLAASLSLNRGGFPSATAAKYGLSSGPGGAKVVTCPFSNGMGLSWSDWTDLEKLDLCVARCSDGRIRIFTNEEIASNWAASCNAIDMFVSASWKGVLERVVSSISRPVVTQASNFVVPPAINLSTLGSNLAPQLPPLLITPY